MKDQYEALAQQFVQMLSEAMHRPTFKNAQDVSRGEVGILACLYECPEGISAGKLAERLHIGSGGIANALKALEAKGFVRRMLSESDRRSVIVQSTDAGRAQAEQKFAELMQATTYLMRQLGEEDASALVRIGGRMMEIGKNCTCECGGDKNKNEQ